MDRQEIILDGYRNGAGLYDQLLSTESLWSKLACKLVWGFPDTAYTEGLLNRIPDNFSGTLLDVPVGTALFTAEKYKRMKEAEIICLDYSYDMMRLAEQKIMQA